MRGYVRVGCDGEEPCMCIVLVVCVCVYCKDRVVGDVMCMRV